MYQYQQPMYFNEQTSFEVDPLQKLLAIVDWTYGLAAQLREFRYQFNATLGAPDHQWYAWNDFLAHEYEHLANSMMVHHSWLVYLQQQKEEQMDIVNSPQYKYDSRLRELNEKLHQAYVEGRG